MDTTTYSISQNKMQKSEKSEKKSAKTKNINYINKHGNESENEKVKKNQQKRKTLIILISMGTKMKNEKISKGENSMSVAKQIEDILNLVNEIKAIIAGAQEISANYNEYAHLIEHICVSLDYTDIEMLSRAKKKIEDIIDTCSLRTRLIKTAGTSKDTRGCSFHYFRYATKHATGEIDNVYYICREFPNITTKTLAEMKQRVGEIA